ncbi:MAG: hypothetical protein QXN55_00245 [Candidatus Nitrosotenuis sp.]
MTPMMIFLVTLLIEGVLLSYYIVDKYGKKYSPLKIAPKNLHARRMKSAYQKLQEHRPEDTEVTLRIARLKIRLKAKEYENTGIQVQFDTQYEDESLAAEAENGLQFN